MRDRPLLFPVPRPAYTAVSPEKLRNDFRLGQILRETIRRKDRAVVRLVRLAQLRRHRQLVVLVRQRTIRIQRPRVQYPLRRRLDGGP